MTTYSRALNATKDEVLMALMELAAAVGNHPDSMLPDGPLHAPFIKAAEAIRKASPPPRELTDAVEVSIPFP